MASKRVLRTLPCISARLSSPSIATALARRQPTHFLGHLPGQATARAPAHYINSIRFAHSIPRPRASTEASSSPSPSPSSSDTSSSSSALASATTPTSKSSLSQQPHYELTFTCVPCGERSRHKMSKQGYHHGSVLIACPGCRNRHVISDHLRIFGDRNMTIEDLMRERGQLVKKGTLGEDGDLEFWDDGTTTVREELPAKSTKEAGAETIEDATSLPGSSFRSVKPQSSE
ncbi:DNL zinc finger-domain-containing protein [Podospora appendiculata]|uniref:DNL zinc finger-domain-containing protein n=1 Tax=Podospora appendiculata TaxID=314037 RepID=A0AAE0XJ50_9PEZI|nr:DNL zinc finger-domain-containing protein [Podospora appendiculata]